MQRPAEATLHPQIQALVDGLSDRRPLSSGSVAQARALSGSLTAMIGAGPSMAAVKDVAHGRLYQPGGAPSGGLVVYFHGGGWVTGQVDDFDALCRHLAASSGHDVLSVDYRLAPEHPFPAAVEDALAAVEWAARGGRRVVVAGDSAGGNLAAVAAQASREVVLQVLVYPVLDHVFDTESYIEHGDAGYLLGRQDMMWFWDQYVPDHAQRDDPRASPLRAVSLTGVAPAVLILAKYDPLLDEGLRYAERLEQARVPVTVHCFNDVTHGFFRMVNLLERADEAVALAGTAIRDAL